ncbi:MAG: SMC family ATPase [Thaumarchaeota archaeon]|nr:SMC family ATPase [Nitrososphaerota archaeon]
MIIRELELKNIRSYEHVLVNLPLGKTLFEGDIGSGKSTILMAIEFALFGLGSETGSSLLRLGEQEGEVRMRFEVDGSEYEVRRGLERKGGGVQQTDGDFEAPAEKVALSPRELKERILEVLQFNEAPEPKAQSLIFRYAVYTPQEEMKEVLAMPSEVRLQTLRRAFRVEDYKTAAENASEISRQMKGDIRELEGVGRGLERLKEQLDTLMREEEGQRGSLEALQAEDTGSDSELKALRAEKEKLHREQLSMEGFRAEKQLQERALKEEERELTRLAREEVDLTERASALRVVVDRQKGKHAPSRSSPARLKARELVAAAEAKRLTSLRAKVESKLGEYGSIMEKGVCPVCDRPVQAHDFEGIRSSKEAELRHLSEELARTEREVEDLREARESTEGYVAEREKVREKRTELARLSKELRARRREKAAARKGMAAAGARLEGVAERMRRLEDLSSQVARAEKGIDRAEEALGKTRERLARTRERLQMSDRRRAELTIEIVAKEGAVARRDRLRENEMWLTGYFVPTVQLIERSVLGSINQEFDLLLQKWFAMLVDDPEKEVRVDEDFTPIVSQGGYEQNVRYLSGGERTSVALAYRLALNTLTQRVSAGMKSNLLMLDEPTDGFSQEQLGNVREVLDDVGSPQVIIVSHDKELESFADQILRVTKSWGVSRVETPEVYARSS